MPQDEQAIQIDGLTALRKAGRAAIGRGPVSLIFAEDAVALEATLVHQLAIGFRKVLLFAPEGLNSPLADDRVVTIRFDPMPDGAVSEAVTLVSAMAEPGTWLHYGYNAEFLFFPFCDNRSVGEMLAFHAEERRAAMVTFLVDLYAPDLAEHPGGVSLADAHFDSAGYYSLDRKDPENDWQPRDRQMDFFGGLRWRFEEHVPMEERRIDRVSLFRADPDVRLLPDDRLNVEEMNTYACPWHNNLTATVASFRAAKALKSNPGSRAEVTNFMWSKSVPFEWHPQQFLDLGLMETGQWF